MIVEDKIYYYIMYKVYLKIYMFIKFICNMDRMIYKFE